MNTFGLFLVLYVAIDAIQGIMFHLQPGAVKCLREELQANVLVTGEYDVSEAPGQQVDYSVISKT